MTKRIIDTEIVRKLALAAAIDLDEESIDECTRYLIKLVDYIDGVGSCEFDDAICEAEVPEAVGPEFFREDVVRDLLLRDDFLANAPDQLGGMIKVPVVIK